MRFKLCCFAAAGFATIRRHLLGRLPPLIISLQSVMLPDSYGESQVEIAWFLAWSGLLEIFFCAVMPNNCEATGPEASVPLQLAAAQLD
jgi:hypothetical protein